MKKIRGNYIHTSAAFVLKSRCIRCYQLSKKRPEVGDVVYGRITRIGQHSSLENKLGRIHSVHNGTAAIFVFGSRYATDYFEGVVPLKLETEIDLLARSGVIGKVLSKNATIKDPTRVQVLGYVCDAKGSVINTKHFPCIHPHSSIKKAKRSPLILVCGTSMNSGKTTAASACSLALSSKGYTVRASKITGTASLQDILHMNDAGASPSVDFSYLGYPSTYLISEKELLSVFNTIDLKYANNPNNFWVVEIADGIVQREAQMLLNSSDLRSRIHKLIFTASDSFSAIGGLQVLKKQFNLVPDAVSGLCSKSPLFIRELSQFTDIPVFNSAAPDLHKLAELLVK